ncbi:MAG: hypothetical protein AAF471_06915, partial [Myxococcota bacterium]
TRSPAPTPTPSGRGGEGGEGREERGGGGFAFGERVPSERGDTQRFSAQLLAYCAEGAIAV